MTRIDLVGKVNLQLSLEGGAEISKQIPGGRAFQAEGAIRAKALRPERAQTAAVCLEWAERRLWWEMGWEKKGGWCFVHCWKYLTG